MQTTELIELTELLGKEHISGFSSGRFLTLSNSFCDLLPTNKLEFNSKSKFTATKTIKHTGRLFNTTPRKQPKSSRNTIRFETCNMVVCKVHLQRGRDDKCGQEWGYHIYSIFAFLVLPVEVCTSGDAVPPSLFVPRQIDCLPPHHIINLNQLINQNLYSAPSRSLLRGAPDPSEAEKNNLENVA